MSNASSGKNGCANEEELVALARYAQEHCPHLKVAGVMTIGAYGVVADPSGDNPDFSRLSEARRRVANDLGLSEQDLELSMGMSGDFELAVS